MLGEVCSDDCVVRIRMDDVIVGSPSPGNPHDSTPILSGKTLWSSLCKLDCIKEPSLQCLCLTWSRMTSRSLSPWPTWPYRYGVVLVDVEEYTGSLNESLLILCSSLTKSRVEECDKSGQNSSCKYCESSMYIVHVCLAPGGSPMDCWGRSS